MSMFWPPYHKQALWHRYSIYENKISASHMKTWSSLSWHFLTPTRPCNPAIWKRVFFRRKFICYIYVVCVFISTWFLLPQEVLANSYLDCVMAYGSRVGLIYQLADTFGLYRYIIVGHISIGYRGELRMSRDIFGENQLINIHSIIYKRLVVR